MGMFDRAMVSVPCPECGKPTTEVQYRVYLGSYQPNLREVHVNTLTGMPKVPAFEVLDEAAWEALEREPLPATSSRGT